MNILNLFVGKQEKQSHTRRHQGPIISDYHSKINKLALSLKNREKYPGNKIASDKNSKINKLAYEVISDKNSAINKLALSLSKKDRDRQRMK